MADTTTTPTPPARSRRPLIAAAAGLAVVVVVAVWLIARPAGGPSQGSVSAPGVESVSMFREPGQTFGYGFGVAYNTGQQPAIIQAIRLLDATPGLEIVATRLSGPARKLLFLDSTLNWPAQEFTDQRPVRGYQLAPATRPDGQRGVELLFGLRAPKLGTYQARAIAVDYTIDGNQHTAVIHRGVKICVVPDREHVNHECGQPTGMNDPVKT
jgi:hypothetical protein